MFLFILESIGTSELILIGIIALIFLGPRKLPQIAKTIGKTMADFRNTTQEFKSTWQREVDFESEAQALRTGDLPADPPTQVARGGSDFETGNTIAPPTITAAQADLFDNLPTQQEADDAEEPSPAENLGDKRNWL